ncbi:MAG: hypothetical protein Ct9H300mP2_2000 [Candidatus Neomarinimicrobiota bacterium]|nr:MAG: hypothetical protein Ct9H300mP2_2000 [Candidatus Neomarinimicrobiota bacterium]
MEPGGQLEGSSPPYENLNDLSIAQLRHRKLLDDVQSSDLIVLHWGLEPILFPDDIDLIHQSKYQLMNDHMEKVNTHGKWMMRNTPSFK